MTNQAVIDYIEKHIANTPRGAYGWYIGITNNAKRRLREHNAEGTAYAHAPADSEKDAREIEAHFLARGFRGGTGGGANPTIVYAYKITLATNEDA